ncbi:hypothetical protein DFJ73DRAFT_785668 [Zopfochytrium polystomum]|nr:hypothetical protein DFJ73DRAFT_785668 [Zopfochytrium polystomum]
MDGIAKFVLSKSDPISFMGGSPSDAKVDPYTISVQSGGTAISSSSSSSSSARRFVGSSPSPSSSSSATTVPAPASSLIVKRPASSYAPPVGLANTALVDSDRPDPASFLIEMYLLSAVTSPLVVVETLAEVQYHPKNAGSADADSELAAYESVGSSTPTDAALSAPKIPTLDGGVWENLREIQETKGEGWLTLFKGHLTGFLYNSLFLYLQPAIEESLNDTFDVLDDTHPLTSAASHILVGTILSPLELIRTRVIVQSADATNRRYFGPIHAAAAITANESGGSTTALYSPSHLIPTIAIHGARAILRVACANIISQDLGLDRDVNPLLNRIATLLFLGLEVGVLTPFEMARKRIQVQRLVGGGGRGKQAAAGAAPQPFKGVVEMAPRHYTGIWNALYWIVAEEGVGKGSRSAAAAARARGKQARARARAASDAAAAAAASSSTGDWQELYDIKSPASTAASSLVAVAGASSQGYWNGVLSLYRGFWARYTIEAVKFAFAEIRAEADDWTI